MRLDGSARLPRKDDERRNGRAACARTLAALAVLGACGAFGTTARQCARAQPPQQEPGSAGSAGTGHSFSDLINPDRPGIADGSQVVGARRFQIETGFERDRKKDGTGVTREVFFPTLFRFGLSDRWEARVESNTFSRSRTVTADAGSGAADTMSGLAPLSLGAKYQFQDQGKIGGKPSLGTILRVFPVSGTGGFRSAHTQADLRLAADWDFTPNLSLNPNIGVALDEDEQGRAFTAGLFAVTLNVWNHDRTINPFIDMGLQAPEEKGGHAALTYDGGIALIVARNYQLDISVGTGAAGTTPAHPFYAAGLSARF